MENSNINYSQANLQELNTLPQFKTYVDFEIDSFHRMLALDMSDSLKNKKMVQIVGNIFESLISCLRIADAAAVIEERFESKFGVSLNEFKKPKSFL